MVRAPVSLRLPPALALASLLLGPVPVLAATPGQPIRASRVTGPITVDGKLGEGSWAAAEPFDGFVQLFPEEGRPPSEPTEVRVVYDDRAIYVGVRCADSKAAELVHPLGRRDSAPFSDSVAVIIDSNRDRRTGYYFELNAAGVQGDALLYGDDESNGDWDAVWDGAVTADAAGWTAEFMIPLSILRFSAQGDQVWGIGIRRVIARTHEELVNIPLKRSDRGIVARLASLTGLNGLQPVQEFSIAPYLAARLQWRPESDAAPQPRLLDPSFDVGVDLRASLGRGLALQATINPDFGQVEADTIQQNLSTYELFYPEKRPFFTQGLDLFQGVTPGGRPSPQQLFYSRRIGLDAPILGAAKLTGRLSDTVQVGLLDAVVAGGAAPVPPTRALYWSPWSPLHLAPGDAYPEVAPARRNFLAATARWQPSHTAALGAALTSATPLDGRCSEAEAAMPDGQRPAHCDVALGHAAMVDWNLHTDDDAWFLRGQLTGSQRQGGPPAETLVDGTVLRPGDLGAGGFVAAGREGGEPWLLNLSYEYEAPRLDVNALGYQRTQNEQMGRAVVGYVRPGGGGPFHEWGIHAGAETRWTTDGLARNRGNTVFVSAEGKLRSFDAFGLNLNAATDYDDVRELEQSGVALRRPGSYGGEVWLSTDRARPFWAEGGIGAGRTLARGPLPTTSYWGVGMTLVLRPHSRFETRLDVAHDDSAWPARFVSDDGAGHFTLAALQAPSFSVTLRQLVVLTPRLTLQAYVQVFTDYGRYGSTYTATGLPGQVVGFSSLLPGGGPASGADFQDAALNLSVVLRWEYRLGSTLFLVYTHEATGPPDRPAVLWPPGLSGGPARDTVLGKWTWYWSR
jgi:hypothetical protein